MDKSTEEFLKSRIRDVKDFPKPGIVFKDITTLIKDPEGLKESTESLLELCEGKKIDIVAGLEARGFIFAPIISHELGKGFVPIRKARGKMPEETVKQKYDLEYGQDEIEIHKDAITKGQNVLIVDDLLATGGTAFAAARLVEKLGGKPSFLFLIELEPLGGRKKLDKYNVYSLLKY